MYQNNLILLVKLGILLGLYLVFEDKLAEFLNTVQTLLLRLDGIEKALAY